MAMVSIFRDYVGVSRYSGPLGDECADIQHHLECHGADFVYGFRDPSSLDSLEAGHLRHVFSILVYVGRDITNLASSIIKALRPYDDRNFDIILNVEERYLRANHSNGTLLGLICDIRKELPSVSIGICTFVSRVIKPKSDDMLTAFLASDFIVPMAYSNTTSESNLWRPGITQSEAYWNRYLKSKETRLAISAFTPAYMSNGVHVSEESTFAIQLLAALNCRKPHEQHIYIWSLKHLVGNPVKVSMLQSIVYNGLEVSDDYPIIKVDA